MAKNKYLKTFLFWSLIALSMSLESGAIVEATHIPYGSSDLDFVQLGCKATQSGKDIPIGGTAFNGVPITFSAVLSAGPTPDYYSWGDSQGFGGGSSVTQTLPSGSKSVTIGFNAGWTFPPVAAGVIPYPDYIVNGTQCTYNLQNKPLNQIVLPSSSPALLTSPSQNPQFFNNISLPAPATSPAPAPAPASSPAPASASSPAPAPVPAPSSSPSPSPSPSSPSNAANASAVAAADSGGSAATGGSAPLSPSPDILSCMIGAKVLYFENSVPAYDRISANCDLKKGAIVTAHVYNKSYDPKSEDNSANLVKTIFLPTLKKAGAFSVGWNGYDDYDQAVALDDYSFVVEAKLDNTYKPDVSIQKFKVDNVPAPAAPAASGTTTTTATSTNATTGATSTITTTTSGSTALHAAAPAPTPSKCPGVNYPTDIDSSPVKDLILKAYDLCYVKGYSDGTFKLKQNITRAESAKIAVLAAGKIAKQGCYDADCGSPFMDLDMWQGPWVRAAWDLKMVVGVSPSQFAPNRSITKAESASLVDKALVIAPHSGCYNASCGAGYPNDIFLDVIQMWEGPYLRALWDRQAIHSVEPHKYFPDTAITREQFVEMLMKARGQDAASASTAGTTTTTSTTSSTATK